MQRKKILWLVSWYPNKKDRFDGDFIQRHARAAAIYHDVHVIFVTDLLMEKESEEEWNYASGLTEQIIYFKQKKGFFGRVIKQWRWKQLYQHAIEAYCKKNGWPHCIHVHVAWKAGLIALWAKRKYKLPFIVTEHWGMYNDVVENNFSSRSTVFRNLLKKIYHEANAFTTVSNFLARGVKRLIGKNCTAVIPNVVDTTLFFYKNEKYAKFSFIHVSNMVPLKNAKGILEAFKELLETSDGGQLQLIMIGNRDDEFVKLAGDLGLLNTSVFFKGEIAYAEVAAEMKQAHCFVLNSVMENSPCVVSEALCCGLPVVATNVGGVPEMIDETNGLLVLPNDKNGLARAMFNVWKNYISFDAMQISKLATKRYGYSTIAGQFEKLYEIVC